MRKTVAFNDNWKFYKGELKFGELKSIHTKDWEPVTLPHTWNALDGQDGGDDYYQGTAWYQKQFKMEDIRGDIYIRFGAISKKAQIWCNGAFVGEHQGGFSAFTLALTPFLQMGENEIFIQANNSKDLPIYPRQADFTFFGGIYREAELLIFSGTDHFDPVSFGTDPLFVTPAINGLVRIDTYITGGSRLYAEIRNAEGECAAKSEITELEKSGKVTLTLEVENVHLWNGTKDAYQYQVITCLYTQKGEQSFPSEEAADEITAAFGFREMKVEAEHGFFLNGEHYPLHGVCRHQDREGKGWAIGDTEHLTDMELIRDMGANSIRLAHYQQAPFFYDLCDRNGMIVWAEIPFISVYDKRREADENLRQQMRELVMQNYNHPSICFWGIANEVGIGGESVEMYAVLKELNQLTKDLDPSRLTTIANVGMTKMSSPLFHITDVTSYNEYKGWYEGSMEDHGKFCDEHHREFPQIPFAISEYGAESILSWHTSRPKIKDYTEEYQALLHEKAYQAFEQREYLWGTWLWNMFDFAADAREEGGCKGRNNKGLVTYDRTVKKQGFYFYKACWSKEPFVYITGKRYTKRVEDKITVKVYSNQKQIDLWVNGTHVSRLCGKRIFEFCGIALDKRCNEILVRTEEGLEDMLILEKVGQIPEAYVLKEEKQISEAAAQWFANLLSQDSGTEIKKEWNVKEGYLSVKDSMEDIYRYEEGFQAVQDLIAKPLAITNKAMADRFHEGGALSFESIWNHIHKYFPDEVFFLLNERLNKIKK